MVKPGKDDREGAFPPVHVQSAFRCKEPPIALAGGQGEAFRCGAIVLKPCRDHAEAGWIAQLHLDVQQNGFRLPPPIRAIDGEWVVDGWQACTFVEGNHSTHRWNEVLATCRAFHDAVRNVSRPAFLDTRNDPFARADRIAWGEEHADVHPRLAPVIEQLQSVVTPVELPDQVIHGDFTENVLFADHLPPAVIDISPFWRPAEYAQAIVIVDALDWYGADESILQSVQDIPSIYPLMARAEIFRIAVLDGLHQQGADTLGAVGGHMKTVDMLTNRLCQVRKAAKEA